MQATKSRRPEKGFSQEPSVMTLRAGSASPRPEELKIGHPYKKQYHQPSTPMRYSEGLWRPLEVSPKLRALSQGAGKLAVFDAAFGPSYRVSKELPTHGYYNQDGEIVLWVLEEKYDSELPSGLLNNPNKTVGYIHAVKKDVAGDKALPLEGEPYAYLLNLPRESFNIGSITVAGAIRYLPKDEVVVSQIPPQAEGMISY